MDRKVLAGVGLVAMLFAVGLGVLLAPSTDVTPKSAPAPAAPMTETHAPIPVASSRPAGITPAPRTVGSPTSARAKAQGLPTKAAPQQLIPASAENLTEQQKEYRCRALGQQADLIDRLVVIGSGGAVDEDQRQQMVSRVAQMSMRVYDEGEHLWSGALSCDGISDVNLGPAADFLVEMRDELDLDDATRTEVEQALGILDAVDWPAAAEEAAP